MKKVLAFATVLVLVAASTAADPKAATEHLGTWRQVAAIANGNETPVGPATLLIVRDDGYTVTIEGKEFQKGTSTVDRTKSPVESEVSVTSGYLAGQKFKQITKIEGDVLIACIGAEQPTEFKSKRGSNHTLSVWIRVK